MAYVVVSGAPEAELVSLADMKNYLRVEDITEDDDLITGLIKAAREYAETYTGKSLVKKLYTQYLDSFPYFTDTVMSQMAYPPSYYALPRYSTTLWNYSQMIKLFYPPLILDNQLQITYIGTDGAAHTLKPGQDFQADVATMPGRLFPLPGQNWPACMYAANAVAIQFTAGYEVKSTQEPPPETGAVTEPETESDSSNAPNPPQQVTTYTVDRTVPQVILTAIKQLVANWYQNREPVVSGAVSELPHHIKALLDSERFIDYAPTRG